MTKFAGCSWLLIVLTFIYPLIVVAFNRFIRYCIPCKKTRKQFLQDEEYMRKLLYILMPLLVLHLELMLIYTDYPFDEISRWIIVVLVILQSYLFVVGVVYFFDLCGNLKRFRKQLKEY